MKPLAIVIALLSSPVSGQELLFDSSIVQGCLNVANSAQAKLSCIGRSADYCMLATTGGQSTFGMSGCLSAEANWWDGQLNQTYQSMMAEARRIDADKPEYAPSQSVALRAMQRAWIPFRDAKCGFAMSQWAGGTGGGPANASCVMQETAEQTLFLQASRIGG